MEVGKKKQVKMTEWITTEKVVNVKVNVTKQVEPKKMIQGSILAWTTQAIKYLNPNFIPVDSDPEKEDDKAAKELKEDKTTVLEVGSQTRTRDHPPGLRCEVGDDTKEVEVDACMQVEQAQREVGRKEENKV